MVRIIGIDPGLRRCGWGVIESEGNRLRYVACGTITPRVDRTLAERLAELHDGLRALISLHRPDEAAVEESRTLDPGGRASVTESTRHRPLAPTARLRRADPGTGVLVYGNLHPAKLNLRSGHRDSAHGRPHAV